MRIHSSCYQFSSLFSGRLSSQNTFIHLLFHTYKHLRKKWYHLRFVFSFVGTMPGTFSSFLASSFGSRMAPEVEHVSLYFCLGSFPGNLCILLGSGSTTITLIKQSTIPLRPLDPPFSSVLFVYRREFLLLVLVAGFPCLENHTNKNSAEAYGPGTSDCCKGLDSSGRPKSAPNSEFTPEFSRCTFSAVNVILALMTDQVEIENVLGDYVLVYSCEKLTHWCFAAHYR